MKKKQNQSNLRLKTPHPTRNSKSLKKSKIIQKKRKKNFLRVNQENQKKKYLEKF